MSESEPRLFLSPNTPVCLKHLGLMLECSCPVLGVKAGTPHATFDNMRSRRAACLTLNEDGLTTLVCLTCNRSVVVPVKKAPPGSLSVNTVGTPPTGGASTPSSTPNIFAAATATPKSMINTTGEGTGGAHVHSWAHTSAFVVQCFSYQFCGNALD